MAASASLDADALAKSMAESSFKGKRAESEVNYENSLGLKYDFIINEKYLIVFRMDLKGFYIVDMDIPILGGNKPKNIKWY